MRRDAGIGEKLRCQTFMSFLAGQGRNEKRVRKEMRERGFVCVRKKERESVFVRKTKALKSLVHVYAVC